MCGILQNDIQAGSVSPEQSRAGWFLSFWNQKNAMPQMAVK